MQEQSRCHGHLIMCPAGQGEQSGTQGSLEMLLILWALCHCNIYGVKGFSCCGLLILECLLRFTASSGTVQIGVAIRKGAALLDAFKHISGLSYASPTPRRPGALLCSTAWHEFLEETQYQLNTHQLSCTASSV